MTDQSTILEQAEEAWKQVRYAEAMQLYQKELATREQEVGPDHRSLVPLLTSLGELAQTQGDYTPAELYYRRALAICENGWGLEHRETIECLGNLAGILDELGNPAQAEPLYVQALTLSRRVLGSDDPATALALAKLARFYRAAGKYDQAEPLYQQALTLYEQSGAEILHQATCMNNYAVLLLETNRPAQAEPLLRKAVRIRTDCSGPEHPTGAAFLKNLGRAFHAQGDTTVAIILVQHAFRICEQRLGAEHPDTMSIKTFLSSLYV